MIGIGLMKIMRINNYLDELYPNPKCELNYNTDYELLISIVLSAQTTDKRVNMVTSVLFSKYNSLEALKAANLSDLEDIIRSIGSFRKKSIYIKEIANILVNDYNSKVPNDHNLLIKLPTILMLKLSCEYNFCFKTKKSKNTFHNSFSRG